MKIRDVFRVDFRYRFARCPDLPLQKFYSYLADHPRLETAETAGFEGVWLLNEKSVMR